MRKNFKKLISTLLISTLMLSTAVVSNQAMGNQLVINASSDIIENTEDGHVNDSLDTDTNSDELVETKDETKDKIKDEIKDEVESDTDVEPVEPDKELAYDTENENSTDIKKPTDNDLEISNVEVSSKDIIVNHYDEIIYNLGVQELTIGNDIYKSEETPWSYDLFEEDGSYTIQLEDNAFFPYEIQFQNGGDIFIHWFDDMDSVLTIGESEISVYSENTDSTAITKMGFTIANTYVPVMPKEKSFETNDVTPLSLFPVQSQEVEVDLSKIPQLTVFDLTEVSISAIYGASDPTLPAPVVPQNILYWIRGDELLGDYVPLTDGIVDLTDSSIRDSSTSSYGELSLFVADDDQLSDSSVKNKYIINLRNYPDYDDTFFNVDIYIDEEGGGRTDAVLSSSENSLAKGIDFISSITNWSSGNYEQHRFSPTLELMSNQSDLTFYYTIEMSEQYSNYDLKVYEHADDELTTSTTYTTEEIEELIANQTLIDVSSELVTDDFTQIGTGGTSNEETWQDTYLVSIVDPSTAEVLYNKIIEINLPNLIDSKDQMLDIEYLVDGSIDEGTKDEYAAGVGIAKKYVGNYTSSSIDFYGYNAYILEEAKEKGTTFRFQPSSGFNDLYDNYDVLVINIPYYSLMEFDKAYEYYTDNPEADVTSLVFGDDSDGILYENPGSKYFVVFFKDKATDNIVARTRVRVYLADATYDVGVYSVKRKDDKYGTSITAKTSVNGNITTHTLDLTSKYSLKDDPEVGIKLGTVFSNSSYVFSNHEVVEATYSGHYNTKNDAENSGATDITSSIFSNGFYFADYTGNGQNFTIILKTGEVIKITIKAYSDYTAIAPIAPVQTDRVPYEKDPFFHLTGAMVDKGDGYKENLTENNAVFVLPYQYDSYYNFGYQTVLYAGPNDLTKLYPTYEVTYQDADITTRVYAEYIDDESGNGYGKEQISGETEQDFSSGKRLQYTSATSVGVYLRNYWVSFVKAGVEDYALYVNGVTGEEASEETGNVQREVYVTEEYDYRNDIFIANIGTKPLTEIKVELKQEAGKEGLELDEYWTIGATSVAKLEAFPDQQISGSLSETLTNIARIRLVPSQEGGEISGTLIISAKELQDDIVIDLIGYAGSSPSLTTDEIPDAVKYVPYAVQILNDNKYPDNQISMSIKTGSLPPGMVLKPNGELYGVPTSAGTFKFTIEMTNSNEMFKPSIKEYTIVVAENTNENVFLATDADYDISVTVGTQDNYGFYGFYLTELKDVIFESEGKFIEFQDFWLNGEKLVKGVDYVAVDGSTRITIREQTLSDKAKNNATNTIAAEFRVDGDVNAELKRTAQNFDLNVEKPTEPEVTQPPTPNEDTQDSDDSDDDYDYGNNTNNNNTSSQNTSNKNDNANTDTNTTTANTINKQELKEEIIEALKPVTDSIILEAVLDTENGFADGVKANKTMKEILDSIIPNRNKAPIEIYLELSEQFGSNKISFNLPMSELLLLENVEKASLILDGKGLGIIKFSDIALKSLISNKGEMFTLELIRENMSAFINIIIDGKIIDTIDASMIVMLPDVAKGEVVVLYQYDNNEDLLKKSVVIDSDVYAYVSGSGKVVVENRSKEFDDVKNTDWFMTSVKFVNSRELFVGVSDSSFAPYTQMSRGMLSTVLMRLEDGTATDINTVFNDVPSDKWYANGINWAMKTGLIYGYGDGTFGPEDSMSREQLVTILYRYANYISVDTIERGDMTIYNDQTTVSDWARESMRWGVAVGLIQGDGEKLNPQDGATRAETAAILERYIKMLVQS